MKEETELILDGIFYKANGKSILKGVFLCVEAGSVTALFGINGTGKSTLLKIAAGQLQADSGITVLDGQRIHRRAPDKRFSVMGYLPQDTMLPDDAAVKSILNSFSITPEVLQDPIIKRIRRQKVGELSGGERRYLEVVLLLGLDRTFYLLDEPFTGVAPLIIELIRDRIKKEAANGKGFLITDHYHHYLLDIAHSAYVMRDAQCYALTGNIKEGLVGAGYLSKSGRYGPNQHIKGR